jgi:hypothetical protein
MSGTWKTAVLATFLTVLFFAGLQSAVADVFDPGRTRFDVRIAGDRISYSRFFLTALPGETLRIHTNRRLKARASAGSIRQPERSRFIEWVAPETVGEYEITLTRTNGAESMTLIAFVMVPYAKMQQGMLEGYRIDSYPREPLRGLTIYLPPRGFVRVTEENKDLPLSPHFTLGQFLCKQAGGYPKFVVLRPKLLLKLEALLTEVNARGIRTEDFHIMSGYRTPYYNRKIGNVDYSRHLWGGAADIFIDVSPRDGVMDDLNRDGTIDRRDAAYLFDIVEDFSRSGGQGYLGGAGEYDSNAVRGPFVHIDVRGHRARWGRRAP